MKVQYDQAADAAYMHLTERDPARFAFSYACDPSEIDGQINLDFDVDGVLVGIEVLQASKKLPRAVLSLAQSQSVPGAAS